jgi:hypothetical protein
MASYVSDPSASSQAEGWNNGWAREQKCRVQFHQMTVLDERESWGWVEEREVLNDDGSVRIEKKRFPGKGRPVFKTIDYIKKFVPGDATNIVDREVRPEDLEEFSREWEAYQKNQSQDTLGTPLEMLPGLSPARIEEFKAFPKAPVRTVEELAGLSDVYVQGFQCSAERDRARTWLLAMEKQAPMAALEAEVAKKDAELAQVRDRLAQLEAALIQRAKAQVVEEELEAPPAPRAARPPARRRPTA